MHNILLLALCAVPVLTGAVQQSPNRQAHRAARVLQRGEDSKKQCHVRTVTYLTRYQPAVTETATDDFAHYPAITVNPPENGYGHGSPPPGKSEGHYGSSQTEAHGYPIDPYPTEGSEYPHDGEYPVHTGIYSNSPYPDNGHSANPPYSTQSNGGISTEYNTEPYPTSGGNVYPTSGNGEGPGVTSTVEETFPSLTQTATFTTSVPVTFTTTLTFTTAVPTTIINNSTATVTSFSISTLTSVSTFTTVSSLTLSATVTSVVTNEPTFTTTATPPTETLSSTESVSVTETLTSSQSSGTESPGTGTSSSDQSASATFSSTENATTQPPTTLGPSSTPSSSGSSTSTGSPFSTGTVSPLETFPLFGSDTGLGNAADGFQLQPQSSGSNNSLAIFSPSSSVFRFGIDPLTGELRAFPPNSNGVSDLKVCCTYASNGRALDPATCSVSTCSLGGAVTAPLQCSLVTSSLTLSCSLSATSIGAVYGVTQIIPLLDGTFQLGVGLTLGLGNSPVVIGRNPPATGSTTSTARSTSVPPTNIVSSSAPTISPTTTTQSSISSQSTSSPSSPVNTATGSSSNTNTGVSSSTTQASTSRTTSSTSTGTTTTGPLPTFPIFAADSGTTADGLQLQPQSGNSGPAIFGSASTAVTYSLDPTTGEVIAHGSNGDQKICCTYANGGSRLDPATCSIGTCSLGGSTVAPLVCNSVVSPLGAALACSLDATSVGAVYGALQVVPLPDGTYQLAVGSTVQLGNAPVVLSLVPVGPSSSTRPTTAPTSSTVPSSSITSPSTTVATSQSTGSGTSTSSVAPLPTFPIFAGDTGISAADGLSLQPQSNNAGGSLAIFGSAAAAVTYSLDPVTGQVIVSPDVNGNRDICCTYANNLGAINPAACSIATCRLGDAGTAPLQCSPVAGSTGVLSCFLNATSIGEVYRIPQIAALGDGTYQLQIGATLAVNNSPVTLLTVSPIQTSTSGPTTTNTGVSSTSGPTTTSREPSSATSQESSSQTGTGSPSTTVSTSGPSSSVPSQGGSSTRETSTSEGASSSGSTTSPVGPQQTFPIFSGDTGIGADGLQLQPQTGGAGSPIIFVDPNSPGSSPTSFTLDPATGELGVATGSGGTQDICCTYANNGVPLVPATCTVSTCVLGDPSTAPLQCTASGNRLDCSLNATSIGAEYTTPQIIPLSNGTYQLAIGPTVAPGNAPVSLTTSRPTTTSSASSVPTQSTSGLTTATSTTGQVSSSEATSNTSERSESTGTTATSSPGSVTITEPTTTAQASSTESQPSTGTTTSTSPLQTFPLFASDTTPNAAGINADGLQLQPQLGSSAPNTPAVFGSGPSSVTYSLDPTTGEVLVAGDGDNHQLCCAYVVTGTQVNPAACSFSTCNANGTTSPDGTTTLPLRCLSVASTGVLAGCSIDATSPAGTPYESLQIAPLADGTFQLEVGTALAPGNAPVTLAITKPVSGSSTSSTTAATSSPVGTSNTAATTGVVTSSSTTNILPTSSEVSTTTQSSESGISSSSTSEGSGSITGSSTTSSTTSTRAPLQTFPVFASGSGTPVDGLQLQAQVAGTLDLAIFSSPDSPTVFGLDPNTGELLVGPTGDQAVCCTYVIGGVAQDPALCSISTCSLGGTSVAPLQCTGPTTDGVLNCLLNATSLGVTYPVVQVAPLANGTFQLEVGTVAAGGNAAIVLTTIRPTPTTSSSIATSSTTTSETNTSSRITSATSSTVVSSTVSSTSTTASAAPTFPVFAVDSGTIADGLSLQPQTNNTNGAPAIFNPLLTSPLQYSINPTTGGLVVVSPNNGNQDVCCQYANAGVTLNPAPCSISICELGAASVAPLQCSLPSNAGALSCSLVAAAIGQTYTDLQVSPLGDGTYQLEIGLGLATGNSPVTLITFAPAPTTSSSMSGGISTGSSSSTTVTSNTGATSETATLTTPTTAAGSSTSLTSNTATASETSNTATSSGTTGSSETATPSSTTTSSETATTSSTTSSSETAAPSSSSSSTSTESTSTTTTTTAGPLQTFPIFAADTTGSIAVGFQLQPQSGSAINTPAIFSSAPSDVTFGLDATGEVLVTSNDPANQQICCTYVNGTGALNPALCSFSTCALGGATVAPLQCSSISAAGVLTGCALQATSIGATYTITQLVSLGDGTFQLAIGANLAVGASPVTLVISQPTVTPTSTGVSSTESTTPILSSTSGPSITTTGETSSTSVPVSTNTSGASTTTSSGTSISVTSTSSVSTSVSEGSTSTSTSTSLSTTSSGTSVSTSTSESTSTSTSPSSTSILTVSPTTASNSTSSVVSSTQTSTTLSTSSLTNTSVSLPESLTATFVSVTTGSTVITTDISSVVVSTSSTIISATSTSVSTTVIPDSTATSTATSAIESTSSTVVVSTSSNIITATSTSLSTTVVPDSTSTSTSISSFETTLSTVVVSTSSTIISATSTSVITSVGSDTTFTSTSLSTFVTTSSAIVSSTTDIVVTGTSTSLVASVQTGSTSTSTSLSVIETTSSAVISSTSSVVVTLESTSLVTSVLPGSTSTSTSLSGVVTTSSSVITSTAVVVSTTTSSSVISSTSTATFACGTDAPAYYIVDRALVREDFVFSALGVVTAAFTFPINLAVGDGSTIDALGFNVADGFLYAAMGSAPSSLIRISTNDGSYTNLGSLGLTATAVAGVVDENAQYWLTDATNTRWTQVDLLPGSATFGQVVASGTTTAPSAVVKDWAYVVGTVGGNNLYGISTSSNLFGIVTTTLQRFNRATHTWTAAQTYVGLGLLNYQSVFAGVNSVYAADSISGTVYNFALPGSGLSLVGIPIVTLAGGPTLGLADGARCARSSGI
ncbi:uncharacterized protein JN550_013244 [Neoarthrinium moseri]|uniref:uncharacterized protein n=1 Tax=Neoarthrinium moseri TaxID=1658444 RepID=UPI001FDE2115|nr:uncharacterized protein JN550_013244 [Neoarthrinium moseri]KAI1857364.1 hypothetical protein JN550_013244 [Neoarthrinium moseri]